MSYNAKKKRTKYQKWIQLQRQNMDEKKKKANCGKLNIENTIILN